jgi:hypothetical protein
VTKKYRIHKGVFLCTVIVGSRGRYVSVSCTNMLGTKNVFVMTMNRRQHEFKKAGEGMRRNKHCKEMLML